MKAGLNTTIMYSIQNFNKSELIKNKVTIVGFFRKAQNEFCATGGKINKMMPQRELEPT